MVSAARIPGCSLWIQSTSPALKRFQKKPRNESGRSPHSALVVASAVLVIAVLVANLQSPRVALALLISLIAAMVIFALVSADMIRQRRRTESHARTAFEDSEQEFHHMADNIQEVFWMIDTRFEESYLRQSRIRNCHRPFLSVLDRGTILVRKGHSSR